MNVSLFYPSSFSSGMVFCILLGGGGVVLDMAKVLFVLARSAWPRRGKVLDVVLDLYEVLSLFSCEIV